MPDIKAPTHTHENTPPSQTQWEPGGRKQLKEVSWSSVVLGLMVKIYTLGVYFIAPVVCDAYLCLYIPIFSSPKGGNEMWYCRMYQAHLSLSISRRILRQTMENRRFPQNTTRLLYTVFSPPDGNAQGLQRPFSNDYRTCMNSGSCNVICWWKVFVPRPDCVLNSHSCSWSIG